jgi:hypothetical protein
MIIFILACLFTYWWIVKRPHVRPRIWWGLRRIRRAVVLTVYVVMMILILASISGAQTNSTIRDTSGRTIGRTVTDSKGNTTFYNSLGQNTGRSSTQHGITTIYNERGQQTGTIRSNK